MSMLKWRAQSQLRAFNGFDYPLFRLSLVAGQIALRGGDDHPVADAPAGNRLRERKGVVSLLRRRAKLKPGAAQRRTVKIHSPAAANNRRAGLLVESVNQVQANERRVIGGNRIIRCS